mgnify:CR=1 FL=1
MTSSTTPGSDLVPVKFSRLSRRGVLLGLSLTQLITLAIGGATLIVAVALDSSIQKVIRSSWARLGKKAIKSEEDGGGGAHAAEK